MSTLLRQVWGVGGQLDRVSEETKTAITSAVITERLEAASCRMAALAALSQGYMDAGDRNVVTALHMVGAMRFWPLNAGNIASWHRVDNHRICYPDNGDIPDELYKLLTRGSEYVSSTDSTYRHRSYDHVYDAIMDLADAISSLYITLEETRTAKAAGQFAGE